MAWTKEQHAQRRAARIAALLCVWCGDPAAHGRLHCRKHGRRRADQAKASSVVRILIELQAERAQAAPP